VLAQLAAAAVAGLPPAGPAERKREPVAIATGGGIEIVGDLVVQHSGFNLHAKTRAGAIDNDARARLLRYVLRPPLSRRVGSWPALPATNHRGKVWKPFHGFQIDERLTLLPANRVRLTLKRSWSDGTYALEMDALALLARLASSVPPPKQHLTLYAGVVAAAAHWRPLIDMGTLSGLAPHSAPAHPPTHPSLRSASPNPPTMRSRPTGRRQSRPTPHAIIPPAPVDPTAKADTPPPAPPASSKPAKPPPSGPRCRYIKWAELLRLTFGLTVDQCPACGGRMKLRALVRDPESIERFLRHQNLWSPPKNLSPARAPPYHRQVTRLAPTRQQELFTDT
jgi:hypothetical protein